MVQSVARTFDILEALVSNNEDMSLSQLHARLHLSVGTIHRLLQVLVERGYAAQDKNTRRYGPGPKLLEVAAHATSNSRFELRSIAPQFLQVLTKITGETSNLVICQSDEIVYIDQAMSSHLVRMFTEIGRRAPLYCTAAGKAILSSWPKEQFETYLQRIVLEPLTPHTLTTRDELRSEIEQTRQRGFAVDNEERELGVRCVAAPILAHGGQCIAALSVSGPATRITVERLNDIGLSVREAADACSTQVGHRLRPRLNVHA